MFKNIGQKLLWAWRILNTDTYVVATDRYAVCSIETVDPYSIRTVVVLGAQRAAIEDLRDKLNELMAEHDKATLLLERK